MKIAVVDNLPEGGAKRVVYEQVKYLALKHEVFLFTNTLTTHFPFGRWAKVYQYDFEQKNTHGFFRPIGDCVAGWKIFKAYRQINKQIKNLKIEVAIYHPCRFSQAPLGLLGNKFKKVYFAEEWFRLIYEPEHHPLPSNKLKTAYEKGRRFLLKILDKYLVGQADIVLTSSQYNKGHLWQVYKRVAEVVPLGVDKKVFKPPVKRADRNYFLFIGEHDDFHGYPLITQILALSDYRLKIKEVNFDQGKFSIDETTLVDMYQQAIATLCLDRSEPFGLVPLESMGCGTPVIAMDEGGYKETVIDKVTGFLVAREAKSIYEKILWFSGDKNRQNEIGRKCRQHIVANYSWEKHGR